MARIQVFLDSDVIVSSLLSRTGASYEVIKNSPTKKFASLTVKEEVSEVAKRLKIKNQKVLRVFGSVKLISIKLTKQEILKNYQKYVFDEEDSHVVAGAKISQARFLLTHNLKHYKVDDISANLGIIVLRPGSFLQYLRSIGKF